jgi:hypothetical protein
MHSHLAVYGIMLSNEYKKYSGFSQSKNYLLFFGKSCIIKDNQLLNFTISVTDQEGGGNSTGTALEDFIFTSECSVKQPTDQKTSIGK